MKKEAAQLKIAIMLRKYLEISWWKFYSKYKAWKEVDSFAKKHNIDL